MSDVTVLGLGNMGSALARTILDGGYAVTAWNRSSSRMEAMTAVGAAPADSPEQAVSASPLTLICVADYPISQELLTGGDVLPRLAGRTVVQLSTGSPQEARELAGLCQSHGAMYLDGAILGLPHDVGSSNCQFLYSGSNTAFGNAQPILNTLGGNIRYLGENAGAASALDLAWLCQRLGMMLGALHGVLLCEAEGVRIGEFGAMFERHDRVRILADIIHDNGYDNPGASVQIWNSISHRLLRHAHTQNINDVFPAFCADLLSKAVEKGLAGEDVAAVIKVLRDR